MRRNVKRKMDQEERVARAYRELRKMAPSLSQYASTYVGKRIRVVADKRTQTDGKTIFIRPPLALADQPEHWRQACGTRDIEGKQMCEACALRENILTQLHHEIAHIAHGSFERYHQYDIMDRVGNALMRYIPSYADTLQRVLRPMGQRDRMASLALAGAVHEHVAMVHLGSEDHRINTASYVREPALWKRMHDLSQDILLNGIEMDDGTFLKWGDRDPDQQIMVAPVFYMEGFDIENHFDQQVVDAVLDKNARFILDRIADGQDSMDNLVDSIHLLSIYRTHGLLTKFSEPREEDKDNEERDEFMKILAEILRMIFGHDQNLGEKGDKVGKKIDPEGREEGSGAGNSDDDIDEDTVVKVITNLKYLDDVPGHIAGVNVFPIGQGICSGARSAHIEKATESVIGKAVAQCRVAFNMNSRANVHRNQRSGKIDSRSLGKRAWNRKDERLFKTKTVPDKRDYEVLIGFDISGSTTMGRLPVSRLDMLKYSVCALADTMHRLGVKFSIYAHNTGYGIEDTTLQGASMDIYIVKTPDEVWSPAIRDRVTSMNSGGSNLDGHTLQFYRKKLDESRATDKVLMYFTDGIMPGMATAEELPILKAEIELCRQRHYTLLGVGVFTDAPKDHGLPTVQVDSEADYPRVIDHLAKRLMK